jgi:PAS domain S-box-containing protein
MEKQSINVLLVEDEPAARRLVEKTLASSNENIDYKIDIAPNLKTAKRFLVSKRFDSILLDLHLPDSKGLNTLRDIRKVAKDVPVIVLSAISDHETGVGAIEQGADYYFVKGEFMREMLGRSICLSIVRRRIVEEQIQEAELFELNSALERTSEQRDDLEEMVNILLDKFSAIFNSIPAMVWIKDLEGKVVTANKNAQMFVGKSMEEILSADYHKVFTSSLGLPRDDDTQIIASGKSAVTEIVIGIDADGGIKKLSIDRAPYINEAGNVVGIIVYARQIGDYQAGVNGSEADSLQASGSDRTAESTDTKCKVKRILIAENDPLNQMLMNLNLAQFGFDVTIVADGQEAIDKTACQEFDLIFMDIRMPNVNGYDATERIKKDGITTPIVAMTADLIDNGEQKCLDAGCDAFLSKPIIRKELQRILKKYLDCEFDYSRKTRATDRVDGRFAGV